MKRTIIAATALCMAMASMANTARVLIVQSGETKESFGLDKAISIKFDGEEEMVVTSDGETTKFAVDEVDLMYFTTTTGISNPKALVAPGEVRIYNLSGHMVKQGKSDDTGSVCAGLDAGVYFIVTNQGVKKVLCR